MLTRTPRLRADSSDQLRENLRTYFHTTFDSYESLFQLLSKDESYYIKPIPLRHPLIFYFGHTATFFINKLLLAGLISERIHPGFESVFAVGVDEMSWDDLDDSHYSWPAVDEVRSYRRLVRERVDMLIRETPLPEYLKPEHPAWAIVMGIEHERIHLETSSVLMRQHDLKYLRTHPAWRPWTRQGMPPVNVLQPVAAGIVNLGKREEDPCYGWDNEYGRHQAEVPAFQAARYLTSHLEYLAFVEDNGYHRDEFWDEEGWGWRHYAQATHPTFWVRRHDQWYLRLLSEEIPMPWDWPVEVNCLEARAFCRWKSQQTGEHVRLPSEDEWYRLLACSGLDEVPAHEPANANLHLDHAASSCPVQTFRHGDFYDVVGNVWQWTDTPIYPFEGFQVHPVYDDFSTPTFDGRHNLIKGGSWISTGNESRWASRYAFRRHFFQHAGFRYVEGASLEPARSSRYESDQLAAQYLELHYGDRYWGVDNFPKAVADKALRAMAGRPCHSALDVGCATGRTTLELAKKFDHVTGVDFSARFIDLAVQLMQEGSLHYTLVDEGELVTYRDVILERMELIGLQHKVSFVQGDACNLKPILTGYDLIVAANLIDRLYQPALFLRDLHDRLVPGGILLLTSPYTWMEEHTERRHWLGGYKKDGESYRSLDGLKAWLSPHFRLLGEPEDIPMVIRETARKFQHTLVQVTIWERL
ncbi:MAG: 5-histidylcysteine sulfoxide synthase [Pseudomonadales bacterium]|nr:5-histidylcysteine sulfoxide synthase [Pseudomonadales bacterium]